MQTMHFYSSFIAGFLFILQVKAFEYVILSHDGPVVLGGTITFKADLYKENGRRPSGTYKYKWQDNSLIPRTYETGETSNTTTYWSINCPHENYNVGIYEAQVIVSEKIFSFLWRPITSVRTRFRITPFLNGNITIAQSNKTVEETYVSSTSEANITINMRKGDLDYIRQKATKISTYWFIDCHYYGQTSDLNFLFNFTKPDVSHIIEALVVASYEPLVTTTVLPPTTTSAISTTSSTMNATILIINGTTVMGIPTIPITTVNAKPVTVTSTPNMTETVVNSTTSNLSNISLPYICSNSSIIPPDPNKTYGHFTRKINVSAPIMNISVVGTNWIQPWDMLSLNVSCSGSGPFKKCLQFHRGIYNRTGNETCDDEVHLHSCNFSIIHYFLEPSVYTILVILENNVSKQIYPLTINIYKVTTKPQLSVIVVPVSCSLAAVVLIVFGVAYYIQNKARFTIEVADFDFGQSNPEMEYKTFTERLRDSFNNAVRPGNRWISARPPYYGSMNHRQGYEPLMNPQNHQ